jgi:hypothetical protein
MDILSKNQTCNWCWLALIVGYLGTSNKSSVGEFDDLNLYAHFMVVIEL